MMKTLTIKNSVRTLAALLVLTLSTTVASAKEEINASGFWLTNTGDTITMVEVNGEAVAVLAGQNMLAVVTGPVVDGYFNLSHGGVVFEGTFDDFTMEGSFTIIESGEELEFRGWRMERFVKSDFNGIWEVTTEDGDQSILIAYTTKNFFVKKTHFIQIQLDEETGEVDDLETYTGYEFRGIMTALSRSLTSGFVAEFVDGKMVGNFAFQGKLPAEFIAKKPE